MRRIGRLLEDGNPNGLRHDLLEQFEPLHGQFRGHDGEPGYVAARARQTCDQAAFQRVARRSHDDRDALRCALRGADRSGTADYDDIDLRPQQIADQRGYRVDIITIMAKLVGDVAPFDITEVAHSAHEFLAEWIVMRGSRPDVPDTRRLAAVLRVRRERPRHRYAAECGQQLPPSDGDCHTPLPCEARKGEDTTPRVCCPNSAASGAGRGAPHGSSADATQLTQCGHPCCERSIGLPSGSQTRDSASRLGGLFLTSVAAPHCLHTGTRASTLSTSKPKWLIPSLS